MVCWPDMLILQMGTYQIISNMVLPDVLQQICWYYLTYPRKKAATGRSFSTNCSTKILRDRMGSFRVAETRNETTNHFGYAMNQCPPCLELGTVVFITGWTRASNIESSDEQLKSQISSINRSSLILTYHHIFPNVEPKSTGCQCCLVAESLEFSQRGAQVQMERAMGHGHVSTHPEFHKLSWADPDSAGKSEHEISWKLGWAF